MEKRYVWKTVLLPNPKDPDIPRLIFKRVLSQDLPDAPSTSPSRSPACTSGDTSLHVLPTPPPEEQSCDPVPPSDGEQQTMEKRYVWKTVLLPNPKKPDNPRLIFKRVLSQDLPDAPSATPSSSSVCSSGDPSLHMFPTPPPEEKSCDPVPSSDGEQQTQERLHLWRKVFAPGFNQPKKRRLIHKGVPAPALHDDVSSRRTHEENKSIIPASSHNPEAKENSSEPKSETNLSNLVEKANQCDSRGLKGACESEAPAKFQYGTEKHKEGEKEWWSDIVDLYKAYGLCVYGTQY